MNIEKKTMICYVFVLSACILFIIGLASGHAHYTDSLRDSYTSVLPVEYREEGDRQVFNGVLPETFKDSQSLLFRSTHATVNVMIDGITVYTFGTEKPAVGKTPGTYWNVVSIPAESAGRELTVLITSVYGSVYGTDSEIYYGSRGECILTLVSSYLPILILNSIIIMMGFVSLLLYGRIIRNQKQPSWSRFLWLGLFSLTIAVWSLRQCGFLQFLIPSGEILYLIDYCLLFLMAPPLNLFVYTISHIKWKKGYLWMVWVYLAGVTVGIVLQIAGIVDMTELLTGIIVLIVVNSIYMFWTIHRESREYTDSMVVKLQIPLYTLLVFGALEILTYYVRMFDGVSVFLPLGGVVFILMLIWQQLEDYYQSTLEEQKRIYYEKLANTDMLTGARSRNAYENMLKDIAKGETGPKGYGAVLFDLNNLKYINDHLGHEKGDEAIKRCYEHIVTAFGDNGNCYRIGGDEFVLLVLNRTDVPEKIDIFNELVERSNESPEFPFRVAVGYAVYDPEQDTDLYNTIRRSDAMMYLDKKQKKEGHC